ncbi:hypothetical protein EDB89DRAFT_2242769 [Lactarius sanguifluus]|nr:hypothetical protein EDB89DRAFT_2242769 [Lactarius sanguifluus]
MAKIGLSGHCGVWFETEIQYGIGAEFEVCYKIAKERSRSNSVTSGSSHELFFVKAFILLRKKSHKGHHFSMSRIGELWGRNVGYGIVTDLKGRRMGQQSAQVSLEQTKSTSPQNPCSGDAISEKLFVLSVFKASRARCAAMSPFGATRIPAKIRALVRESCFGWCFRRHPMHFVSLPGFQYTQPRNGERRTSTVCSIRDGEPFIGQPERISAGKIPRDDTLRQKQ